MSAASSPSTENSSDDPRFQHSHTALAGAMFEMAASRPAEQISVSELADRAGVSRRTFYRHAGSPVEFLSHLLAEEHRELEETLVDTLLMPTQESSDAWKAAYAVMLDHVDRRLGS